MLRNADNSSSNPSTVGITVAAKDGNANPSSTGIRVEERKEPGSEPTKKRSPNPSGAGTGGLATKKRIIDWVQRRFGTSKEALNVTLHHSCQEIPSQTYGESPRRIDSTRATKNGSSLWSNEVLVMNDNFTANNTPTIDDQRGNTQLE